MNRTLYRYLLWVHPPAFRRQFGDEMMCVFDECAAETGGGRLMGDALTSLLRQWFLRTALWKVLAAIAGGALELQIALGMIHALSHFPAPGAFNNENPEMSALVRLIALTTLGLLSSVIGLVFWWRYMSRRIGV